MGLGLALAAGSAVGHEVLGVEWTLHPDVAVAGTATAGWGVLVLSDGVLHLALARVLGPAYRARYDEFVRYCRPQSAATIAAAGLLAGAEELFFRGVVLAHAGHDVGGFWLLARQRGADGAR